MVHARLNSFITTHYETETGASNLRDDLYAIAKTSRKK